MNNAENYISQCNANGYVELLGQLKDLIENDSDFPYNLHSCLHDSIILTRKEQAVPKN